VTHPDETPLDSNWLTLGMLAVTASAVVSVLVLSWLIPG